MKQLNALTNLFPTVSEATKMHYRFQNLRESQLVLSPPLLKLSTLVCISHSISLSLPGLFVLAHSQLWNHSWVLLNGLHLEECFQQSTFIPFLHPQPLLPDPLQRGVDAALAHWRQLDLTPLKCQKVCSEPYIFYTRENGRLPSWN